MTHTTFREEQALNRAAARLEALAEEADIEAMRVLVKLTPDPDNPGCCRGWEAANAMDDGEVRRVFEADDWRSWELSQSADIEALEQSSGEASAYRRAAEIVREEASA